MLANKELRCGIVAALLLYPIVATSQSRPLTDFRYDANGNMTWSKDALGRVTTQRYNAHDLVTSISLPRAEPEAERTRVRLRYDGRGEINAVIDPRGLTTRYVTSGLGYRAREDSPDSGLTRFTFDASGNVRTSRDARGKVTTFTYDQLDRLTRVEYANEDASTFEYDQGANAIGRLTRMSDPGPVTTTWTYDTQGRVAGKQQTVEVAAVARTHSLHYGYHPTTSQLQTLTYPSGRVVSFSYGASRRIESVSLDGMPIVTGVMYHPSGGVGRINYSNGSSWSQTFDIDGRPTSYSLGGVEYSVEWDRGNRIRAIRHATTPFWSAEYGYDGLDRVATFNSEPRTQTFKYDDSGNLLQKTDRIGSADPSTLEFTIDPASNRMLGISNMGVGYTYDKAGNRTSDNTRTWVIDARGRVRQLRVIDGAITRSVNYITNGQDLRVMKRGPAALVPQGTRIFVYDEASRLIGEYDNLGRARVEHIWLDARPIAFVEYRYQGSALVPQRQDIYYVETDHLGTPRFISDSARALRWHWSSAPYGDTHPNENPSAKGVLVYNLRFAGQYFDVESSHSYNWHRDYDPVSGRYIQADPIGLAGGLNSYAYANGNPLINVDPTGQFPIIPIAAGFARCMMQCAAIETASSLLMSGGEQCLDARDLAATCTADCLNPLNWLKFNAAAKATSDATTAIGRVKDLQKLSPGEKSLLDKLPYRGDPKSNWQQNAGVLREEMRAGKPIRDASPGDTSGQFLEAERNLLKDRGWSFDSQTNHWLPPK